MLYKSYHNCRNGITLFYIFSGHAIQSQMLYLLKWLHKHEMNLMRKEIGTISNNLSMKLNLSCLILRPDLNHSHKSLVIYIYIYILALWRMLLVAWACLSRLRHNVIVIWMVLVSSTHNNTWLLSLTVYRIILANYPYMAYSVHWWKITTNDLEIFEVNMYRAA